MKSMYMYLKIISLTLCSTVDCSAALMSDPNCFRCGFDHGPYNQSVCVECKVGTILQDGICERGTACSNNYSLNLGL